MSYINTQTDNNQLNTDKATLITDIQTTINKLTDQKDSLNSTTDSALITTITSRISELKILQEKISAYQGRINTVYSGNVANAQTLGSHQTVAEEIMNAEKKNNDERLAMLNAEKYNKVRLIQNNVYYGKYYNAHKQIMKTIFLVCVPILILLILGNMGYIPPNLKSIIIMIIIVIGCVSIGYQIIDLTNRDNMNFDAYNWKFNKKLAPPIETNVTPFDPWATPSISLGCVNGGCCPVGYEYKLTPDNKCVVKSTTS